MRSREPASLMIHCACVRVLCHAAAELDSNFSRLENRSPAARYLRARASTAQLVICLFARPPMRFFKLLGLLRLPGEAINPRGDFLRPRNEFDELRTRVVRYSSVSQHALILLDYRRVGPSARRIELLIASINSPPYSPSSL